MPAAGLGLGGHSKRDGQRSSSDHNPDWSRHAIREQTATGTFAVTWSPIINNNNSYLAQRNVRTAAGFVSFNGTTLGGCSILTYNAAGALTDIASGCHVMIFRMP